MDTDGTMKILVVDDEAAVRHLVARVVAQVDCEPILAANGGQALELDLSEQPDLVITDLKMLGMDGVTLARELLQRDPDRPVILLTGNADVQSARDAVEAGVYRYYLKPFDIEDLASGIRRALEHRRLLLESRAHARELEVLAKEGGRAVRLSSEAEQAYAALMSAVQQMRSVLDGDALEPADRGSLKSGLVLVDEAIRRVRRICGV